MTQIDSFNFQGKRALIRVDFNVPLDEALKVTDDTRITAALPTIQKVLKDGGSIVLMSHLGRPKDGPENRFSLRHIIPTLERHINTSVKFATDCVGEKALKLSGELQSGEVLLLENLRFHPEEKSGDEIFAQQLSELGDVYINDAFGTAHRAHASTTVVAKYFDDRMFGFLMKEEVANGQRVLTEAKHPYTAIIGGAKVSSKLKVITNLLPRIDNLIIGGGMAYTFIKAQGGSVGDSLVENDYLDTASQIIADCMARKVRLYLPEDSVVADKFGGDAASKTVLSKEIEDGWMGLDVGPKAIEAYRQVIAESETILWNGPLGVFEFDKFAEGTKALGEMIARSNAYSLVGGGDSVAAVRKFNLVDRVSYVSTGGGALLELLEGKTLPGVAAILR